MLPERTQLWPRLAGPLAICAVALAFLWRPVVGGEVFLPLDALLHLQPWRYSYERVAVNSPRNTDPIRQIYPRRLLTNRLIAQGALPLWNSTALTGIPNIPDGQLALFYPPTLLFLLVPLEQAFGYYALFQLALAGLGAYALARALALGRAPATLAGVCYALNGYMLTWLQFPHHSGAAAMLPWCFWSLERACAGGSWRRWALAGALFALPVLCHIQLAFYTYLALGAYALLRAARLPAWRSRGRVALGFGGAIAAALLLSALQLAPALALSAEAQRTELPFAPGDASSQFEHLLRLVLPSLGGWERIGPAAWGPPTVQYPQPYVGLAPLALAAIGLLLARHPVSVFFGLLASLSFALALNTPLVELLIALVPPYRQFEDHSRWFALWGLAAALLAAMGAQALGARTTDDDRRPTTDDRWPMDDGRRPTTDDRRTGHDRSSTTSEALRPLVGGRWSVVAGRALFVALVLFVGGFALSHLQLFTPQSRYGLYITAIRREPLAAWAAIAAVSAGAIGLLALRRVPRALAWPALIAVVVADIGWCAGAYNTSAGPALARPTTDLTAELAAQQQPAALDTLYPPTRQVAFLLRQPGPFRIFGADQTTLPPNLATTYGLEDIRGYHSLYPERYNRFARLVDGKDYTHTSDRGAILRPYFTSAHAHRRLLDMLNVKYLIFPPGSADAERYAPLEPVHLSDEGVIYHNPRALPRAWLVRHVEVIAQDDDQLARMAQPDFDPAATVILPAPPPPVPAMPVTEGPPTVAYAPNRAEVRVRLDAPAVLVMSDMYTDDWSVAVDGRPATLYRANYTFRAVWLPGGEHLVEFSYRPRALAVGAAVSATTTLGLVALAAWPRRRREAQR